MLPHAGKLTIGIVGAGINGLCVAFVLAHRGHHVTVFDKAGPPFDTGSSAVRSIDWQILRTHYTAVQGYLSQAGAALGDWKQLFTMLGRNYFLPTGIASISREPGDWSDQLIDNLRRHQAPFRILSAEQIAYLYPGFDLRSVRFGIVSDLAGVIDARRLDARLRSELVRMGATIKLSQNVTACEGSKVYTEAQAKEFDRVIVTADHAQLLPEFDWHCEWFTACYCDLVIPQDLEPYWRYAPAWVDLGGSTHQWGIPRVEGGRLRIASGYLTTANEAEVNQQQTELLASYAGLIHEFARYSPAEFHQLRYSGRVDGRFQLHVNDGRIGLQADSGHGYKFAASHAFALADALETGVYHSAIRRVAGVA